MTIERIDRLHATIDQLTDRLAELEETVAENEALKTRIEEVEAENDQLREELAEHERRIDATDAKTDAIAKKSHLNKDRIEELQSRELEKGAHLETAHVDTRTIDVHDNKLEKLTKDDGKQYFRLPNGEDPLDRGGQIQLAHGDLLPVQQLARLDEDMLRSTTSSRPARLAAKLWKARADDTVGDNPWKNGSQTIREFVKASDLKQWIRRQDPGSQRAMRRNSFRGRSTPSWTLPRIALRLDANKSARMASRTLNDESSSQVMSRSPASSVVHQFPIAQRQVVSTGRTVTTSH